MPLHGLTLRRHVTAEGPRDADDVWDRYARPARWPEWSPQIRSVDYASQRLAAGTSGVVHGVGGLEVRFQITHVEPSAPRRSWSWTATAAGVQLRLTHTVESLTTGSRTGLTIEGFAPAVAAYLPLARYAIHRLVH